MVTSPGNTYNFHGNQGNFFVADTFNIEAGVLASPATEQESLYHKETEAVSSIADPSVFVQVYLSVSGSLECRKERYLLVAIYILFQRSEHRVTHLEKSSHSRLARNLTHQTLTTTSV